MDAFFLRELGGCSPPPTKDDNLKIIFSCLFFKCGSIQRILPKLKQTSIKHIARVKTMTLDPKLWNYFSPHFLRFSATMADDLLRLILFQAPPFSFHFLPSLSIPPSVEVPQPERHTSDFNSWPLNAEVSAAPAAISHSRWKGNEHWGCWGWHGALTTPAIATLTASLHQAGIWEEPRRRC